MAELWVRENYLDDFKRELKQYEDRLDWIAGTYQSARQALSDCAQTDTEYRICRKLKQQQDHMLDKKADSRNLYQKVKSYVEDVQQADAHAASQIHELSYSFYKEYGIGPQKDTFWHNAGHYINRTIENFFMDAASTADQLVHDWNTFLEEHTTIKYGLELLGDCLKVIGAIGMLACAAGTGLGIIVGIGAGYLLACGLADMAADGMAVIHNFNGDDAEAEDSSNWTLTKGILDGSKWLDQSLGINVVEPVAKFSLCVLETFAFAAGIITFLNGLKEPLHLDGLKSLDMNNPTHRSWKQSWHYFHMIGWKDRLSSIDAGDLFTLYQKDPFGSFGSKGGKLGEKYVDICTA